VRWCGGGGFGDPTRRDPSLVQHDLDHFNVSPEAARSIYGAVLDQAGKVDSAATEKNRVALRAARVARHPAAAKSGKTCRGPKRSAATENLAIHQEAGGLHFACAYCAHDLGPANRNYKDCCVRENAPVSESNPLVGDPARFIDDAVEFRKFCCPGCGSLIENEIAVASDPPLADAVLTF
jgi:N-methylhydantoinase B